MKWRVKANESKLIHVTSTKHTETCPPVHINKVQLPQAEDVKYLGLHLDRSLTWHKNIFTKRKELGLTFTKMHWLLGRKSKLSTINKILNYKMILKAIWTYVTQLRGTISTSNIEILERFQSKTLPIITNAPWYAQKEIIRKDLQIPTVKEGISRHCTQYSKRLIMHTKEFTLNLEEPQRKRGLQGHMPIDLPSRFNM
jgi:hypothetical protein